LDEKMKKNFFSIFRISIFIFAVSFSAFVKADVDDCASEKAGPYRENWLGPLTQAILNQHADAPSQIKEINLEYQKQGKSSPLKPIPNNYRELANGFFCRLLWADNGPFYVVFVQKKEEDKNLSFSQSLNLKNRLTITAMASKGANAFLRDPVTCYNLNVEDDSGRRLWDGFRAGAVKVEKIFPIPEPVRDCN